MRISRASWVEGLPRVVEGLIADWSLARDGVSHRGRTTAVVPVRDPDGRPAVLKVAYPDEASEHEHLALQHWHGDGAVRLLRAHPARSAMLLERLHGTDLGDLWDVEACEIVGGLYARLHVPALPQLRRLSSRVAALTDRLADLPRSAPVPRRLVEQAVSLGRAFVDDDATDARMVHGDLHYGHVLAADREPWLAIDPEPMGGDPHYEIAPLLWNRWGELAGDVRGGVRRRFLAVVDAAGLDEDRARDWVVVRTLHATLRELEEPAPDHHALTRNVAIAKAVQE